MSKEVCSNWIAKLLCRHRWVIVAAILATLASAPGLFQLTFSSDNRDFFDPDDPELLVLTELENTFTRANNLIFIVTPDVPDVFNVQTLHALERLTDELWSIPHSTRVDSLTNFQHIESDWDDIRVFDLVEDASGLTTESIEKIRHIALNEPTLVGRLLSTDGAVTAIEVLINNPGQQLDEVPNIASAARHIANQYEQHFPHLDIRISGGIMADATFAEAGQNDIRTLVPLMIVSVFLIVFIGTRSGVATLIIVGIVVLSVIITMGVAGFANITINSASSSAPIMIMTLCIADCIHIFTSFVALRSRQLPLQDAVINALQINFFPVLITSVTTAIGFLSLNFSLSPPLRDLGNIVAIGVMVGFILSCSLFPILLYQFKRLAPRQMRG